MKNSNNLQINDLSFEKDFLLLHEILAVLRQVGMSVTGTGSEAKGMIPLYEFQHKTAHLHFGTLVGLLNHPEKFTAPPGILQYFQNLKLTSREVDLIRYEWNTVAIAIDILEARKEVTKEVQGQFFDLDGKVITLTEEGLYSLNTQKYLMECRKERGESTMRASTLSTNRLTRLVGLISIPAAIFAATIGVLQFTKPDEIKKEDVHRLIHAVEQIKSVMPPAPAALLPVKK